MILYPCTNIKRSEPPPKNGGEGREMAVMLRSELFERFSHETMASKYGHMGVVDMTLFSTSRLGDAELKQGQGGCNA